MKVMAICNTCAHQHAIEFDPFVGPGSAFGDWLALHPEHKIDFCWPGRSGKRDQSSHGWEHYLHNANIKVAYAASAAYTITLASLATDANLLVGRESTAVANTTNLYLDYLVGGVVRTGTSPTVDKQIEVWAYGALNDTPTYPDILTGSDAGATITNAYIKSAILRLVAVLGVTATSNVTYPFAPTSLAARFGAVPTHHGLFVVHNTAVNLHATGGSHFLKYTPTYATSI